MVRKLRRVLNFVVPGLGMALVIGAVVFGESLAVQLALVVAGLLMTEAGAWRLADPLLPDERRYVALRAEAEHFMALVRQLNTAALALDEGDLQGSRFAMDEIETEMHRSIDRMVTFAGEPEPAAAAAAAGSSGSDVPAPGRAPESSDPDVPSGTG